MKEFEKEIKEHITDGCESFLDLKFTERAELIALYLKETDDKEWLYDVGIFEAALEVLRDLKPEYSNVRKDLLVNRIISAANEYCEKTVGYHYINIYNMIQHNKNLEAELRPFIDAINGEIRWMK